MTDTFDQAESIDAEAVEPDQNEDQVDEQAGESEESEDDGTQDQEDDLEYDEVERNGRKYRIPKDLAPDLLRQDDYTRKTQSLAQERKALESERLAFQGASKEIDDKTFELKGIDRRLADLGALTHEDWSQLRLENPDAYDRLNRELVTLPRQREGLAAELKAKTDEVLNAQQEIQAKRIQEGQAELARDIKGWGPEMGAKLIDFVTKDFGVTGEDLGDALYDPRVIKIIHAAYQNREQAQRARVKTDAEKASAVKPIGGVKGKAVPKTGLSDELPTDEWMKRERERTQARRTGTARR